MNLAEVVQLVSGGGTLALAIIVAISKWGKEGKKEVREDSESKAELEMKLKELEGKINAQYAELKLSITALEKAVADGKSSNYAFETRLLASVDKLDSKMERIQDYMLKTILNNQDK